MGRTTKASADDRGVDADAGPKADSGSLADDDCVREGKHLAVLPAFLQGYLAAWAGPMLFRRYASKSDQGSHRATRVLLGSLSVGCMLLAWLLVAQSGLVPPELLPGPGAVFSALIDILENGYRGTTLAQNILATVGRCLGGFALAILLGVPLGLWMGTSRFAAAAVDYIVQFLRPLPPLSYMILLILWLGTGNASKTALLFLTAFPIVTSAAMAGVRGVKRQRVQAALTLGASRTQVFRHVVLPSALPMIFTGLSIALAAAFSTVVAAELMAATNGLGWMVISASHFLRGDVIILGILLLGLLGIALSRALMLVDKYLVHWRGRD